MPELEIAFTWYVPDTLTLPEARQAPIVGKRGGVDGVVVAVPWALKGVAGDKEVVISMTTPVGGADPASETFKPFDQLTTADLERFLFAAPDGIGSLHKSDQEGQVRAKLLELCAPARPAKLGEPLPAAPGSEGEGES